MMLSFLGGLFTGGCSNECLKHLRYRARP